MADHDDIERYLYARNGRWYADLRSFSDVGGSRESLIPPDGSYATRDRNEALELARARVEDLEQQRSGNSDVPGAAVRLRSFAPQFLKLKARETDVSKETMDRAASALKNALRGIVDEHGQPYDPFMHEVTVADVRRLKRYLRDEHISPHTGRPLSNRSIRYATDVLSECFVYAAAEGHVPRRYDPVEDLPKRTSTRGEETDFLEPHEAAAVLHMLIEHEEGLNPHVLLNFVLALTGARRAAGAGLLTREVDRTKGVVLYQSNRWRNIKTREKGYRAVPIWPQLELALEAYRLTHERDPADLLLPGRGRSGETMITGVKKRLDAAQEAAAKLLEDHGVDHLLWDRRRRSRPAAELIDPRDLPSELEHASADEVAKTTACQVPSLQDRDDDSETQREKKELNRIRYKGARASLLDALDEKRVTPMAWRTTYATARVQTLDHGKPVARSTVAGELGHNSNELLDNVYARVGSARGPRKEVVEYRLPDGSLPGEDLFRSLLGSRRVDRILDQDRIGDSVQPPGTTTTARSRTLAAT